MFRNIVVACITVLAASQAFAVSLEVKNRTRVTVSELYLAPAGDKSWGPDQLRDNTIAPGNSFTLRGIPKGKYDVKLTTKNGKECEIEDADFDDDMEWTLTSQLLNKCEDE